MTSEQAAQLGVKAGSQISPYLEMCCLRSSANVSYQHAEQDIALLTRMRVSAKTQQRLVQRQPWEALADAAHEDAAEMSIDGGNLKLAMFIQSRATCPAETVDILALLNRGMNFGSALTLILSRRGTRGF